MSTRRRLRTRIMDAWLQMDDLERLSVISTVLTIGMIAAVFVVLLG